MTDKGGTGSGQGAVVQDQRSADLHLVHDGGEFTRHLHGGFDRVDGHQEDAEEGGRRRGRHRLHPHGQITRGVHRVHGGQYPRIGRRVTETTERTLHERRKDTL